jgi:membrane-bound lytic murein transglycosylase MltF
MPESRKWDGFEPTGYERFEQVAIFAFAAYNAGPGRVKQLRQEAQRTGLDPNVWFTNVERIASKRIGRETVTYVSNIYKYSVAYRLSIEELQERKKTS